MSIDYTSPEGKVRLNIGDVTIPYLISDELISALLSKYSESSEIEAVYKTTVDALTILKGRFALTAERRREREGGVEIEAYSAEKYQAICDLLDYWKENPPEGIQSSKFAGFIFGGVNRTEVKRVEDDPLSISGFTEYADNPTPVIPDWRLR